MISQLQTIYLLNPTNQPRWNHTVTHPVWLNMNQALRLNYFLGISTDLTGITRSECWSAICMLLGNKLMSRQGDFLYPQKHFYVQNLQWFWKLLSPLCSHLHVDDVMMCLSSVVVLSHNTGKKCGWMWVKVSLGSFSGQMLCSGEHLIFIQKMQHLHGVKLQLPAPFQHHPWTAWMLFSSLWPAVPFWLHIQSPQLTPGFPGMGRLCWTHTHCSGPSSPVPVQLPAVQNRRLIPIAIRTYVNK